MWHPSKKKKRSFSTFPIDSLQVSQFLIRWQVLTLSETPFSSFSCEGKIFAVLNAGEEMGDEKFFFICLGCVEQGTTRVDPSLYAKWQKKRESERKAIGTQWWYSTGKWTAHTRLSISLYSFPFYLYFNFYYINECSHPSIVT